MARKEKRKINTSKEVPALSFNPFEALEAEKFPEREVRIVEEDEKPQIGKPTKKGRVVLRRETANRGGKTVVVISDFALEISQNEIEEIFKNLKKHCGCGGVMRGREVEIQGEQIARVRVFLSKQGFRVDGVK